MKVFKKSNSKSKMQDEAAASEQKEPLTPQKSEDSEESSQDEGAEVEDGEEEGGAMGKIWSSITGICGGGADTTTDGGEWCNMKEGMAEI